MMRRRGEGSFWVERRRARPVRYVVQWSLPDGRRVKRRFESEAAALDHLKSNAPARLASDMTLGAYLAVWLQTVRPTIAPATFEVYESTVRLWLSPNLGSIRLDRLSVARVREYLFGSPLHPQTVSHHRAVLRKALNDARADGLVQQNVAAMAKPPTVPQQERRWLDADQLRALFDATEYRIEPDDEKDVIRGSRFHALWVLAGTTGLRSAELRALGWDDIDLDVPRLTVRHTLHRQGLDWVFRDTKTKATRSIPLGARAVAALKSHRARQTVQAMAEGIGSYPLVFTTPTGRPYHREDLSKFLRADLEAASLPVVTLHQLRHSCASWMLATGTPIQVIAELLGHSTPAITQALYTHVGEELKRDAVRRLEDVV